MKIIDCFIFYNELDLLSYRFNILNSIVDYFVIVEATHTFSGKEKTLHFNDNKHLFKEFENKIIHIIVDDFPYKYPNINIDNEDQWQNEYFQRNCIARGINLVNSINDNDLITICDVDEIPDPDILIYLKNQTTIVIDDIYILEMDFYYYNLNTKHSCKWHPAKIISYKKYNELNMCCNDLRCLHSSSMHSPLIKNGGWHLSYFGDNAFIKNKLENFSHQEYNNSNYTDLTIIENKIKNAINLFDENNFGKTEITNNLYLPKDYDIYLKKYYN